MAPLGARRRAAGALENLAADKTATTHDVRSQVTPDCVVLTYVHWIDNVKYKATEFYPFHTNIRRELVDENRQSLKSHDHDDHESRKAPRDGLRLG